MGKGVESLDLHILTGPVLVINVPDAMNISGEHQLSLTYSEICRTLGNETSANINFWVHGHSCSA